MTVARTYLGTLEPQYEDAPDETWLSRDTPPEPGIVVEGFWPGRGHRADIIHLVTKSARESVWCNLDGDMIAFNPSFWRPVNNPKK